MTNQEIVDELLSHVKNRTDLKEVNEVFRSLKKAVLERMLGEELTAHLGYEKHAVEGRGSGNSRNGATSKRVITDHGELEIEVPRDRSGTFEPVVLPKHHRRLEGFDDRVISMYSRGMSVREIQEHIEELYGVAVGPDLISRITDGVLDEIKGWQNRPLEALYAIVVLDCLMVRVRHEGQVRTKAVYVALGYTMEGLKDVLGLWMEETEGAKFWLKVLNELKNRGVKDILIACVDGLKGFPEAIAAAFPKTVVQGCVVHMLRNSCAYVSYGDRKEVASDLKPIYRASTEEEALSALEAFRAKWDRKYPMIAKSWKSNWETFRPFLVYPEAVRKLLYTTNAIESLNMTLRRSLKTRGHFPSDEAVTKVLYLALKNHAKNWKRAAPEWSEAKAQFAIMFEDRIQQATARS